MSAGTPAPAIRDAGERLLDRPPDPGAVAALRRAFREHGFTAEGVRGALGVDAFVRDPFELTMHLRMLAGGGPLATLIRLFLLGMSEPRPDVEAALAPLEPERLVHLGLLDDEGDRLSATLAITPSTDLLGASDWEREDRLPTRADHVMGVSSGSRALARLTPRRPVHRALDLGTGAGVQALLVARHAETVVGVDLNPRCLRVARLNALLNGVDNLELREGSLFEPVAGERFDLIVGNPPYVVSPETDYVFRDAGLPGDSFCEAVVRATPQHLEEGGIAQLLVSWLHGDDADPTAPIRDWTAGSDCDVLLLHFVSSDPLTYAAGWNRLRGRDAAAFDAGVTRWMAHFDALGIEQIAWGALLLRKRGGGDNWFWSHTPGAETFGPAGDHLERMVAAQDLLNAPEAPVNLAGLVLAPPEDARLEQVARPRDGELEVESLILGLDGGIGSRVALDPVTAELVAHMDGRRTLHQALSDTAARVAPGDEDAFVAAALPAVARMLELGLLVPAS